MKDLPELNSKETEDAIREGKLKKFFHERNKHYWAKQETDAIERERLEREQLKQDRKRKTLTDGISALKQLDGDASIILAESK